MTGNIAPSAAAFTTFAGTSDVTHDANPAFVAVVLQSAPLSKEFELPVAVDILVVLGLLQRHEAGVRFQPAFVAFAKATERFALAPRLEESLRRLCQDGELPMDHPPVIDAVHREVRPRCQVALRQILTLDQPLETQ